MRFCTTPAHPLSSTRLERAYLPVPHQRCRPSCRLGFEPRGVHGFLYNGSFTTIEVPGARGDLRPGINNAGQIVGIYYDVSTAADHGFVYNGSSFTTIDLPGANSTSLVDINDAGQMIGAVRGQQWVCMVPVQRRLLHYHRRARSDESTPQASTMRARLSVITGTALCPTGSCTTQVLSAPSTYPNRTSTRFTTGRLTSTTPARLSDAMSRRYRNRVRYCCLARDWRILCCRSFAESRCLLTSAIFGVGYLRSRISKTIQASPVMLS